MSQILGFTPDADQTVPGVVLDCEMLLPSDNGMRACPSSESVGNPPLDDETRGAFAAVSFDGGDLVGANRMLVGTSAALYEGSLGSWTDVSGQPYDLGTDGRWSFVQYGNAVLAATPGYKIQRSESGAFAEIAEAPNARLLVSLKLFVIAFDTNDSVYGPSQDRWWCSAYADETDWTPNVATQCTTGRIVESSGRFTAAARAGDDVVAYKRNAMWLGRYVGAPVVWQFDQIASDIGCVGQDAVCDTGAGHIFVGSDDIYIYDGARPRSITDKKCREWFVNHRDPKNDYKTRILWDKQNSLAWIFYASAAGVGEVDSGLIYHVRTGKWGRANLNVESVVVYSSPPITYDQGTPLIDEYDNGPGISYDSPFWTEGQQLIAYVDNTHTLLTISGRPNASSYTTGDFGDEMVYSRCNSLKVRHKTAPDAATVTGYVKDDSGAPEQQSSSAIRNDGAFDVRQYGRWHRFKVDQVGPSEIMAFRPTLVTGGRR